MALGSDGTMIICTLSGHVFVRQRVKAGAGQLKFKRVPYLQRVIKVAVNESGAFAAIRVDAKPAPISLTGRTLEQDMASLLPHVRRFESQMTADDFDRAQGRVKLEEEEEDESSVSVSGDITKATRLCETMDRWRSSSEDSLFAWEESLLGSDLYLKVGELNIPAHATVLRMRCPVLGRVMDGGKVDMCSYRADSTPTITVKTCHPLVGFLLLEYLYADDVPAVWDPRVARVLQQRFKGLRLPIADIKSDSQRLARVLELAPLINILEAAGKTTLTTRTLPKDLQSFFASTYLSSQPASDVTLVLADKTVSCSSVILRARCPFFDAMFSDSDWTATRRDDEGRVLIHLEHLKWRPMKLVFKYIHTGYEDDLFDYLRESRRL